MELNGENQDLSGNKGIASIEASIVVTLLIFVSLFFFEICEIKTVEATIYEAASETAEYMAEYSYLTDHLGMLGVTDYPMAQIRFMNYVDDKALLEKYVTGGIFGVSLIGSQLPGEDNFVEIRYAYQIKLSIPILCNFTKLCTGKVRQCAYFGKDVGSSASDVSEEAEGEKVYLADGSEVYHKDKDCTYLRPSVTKTILEDAKEKGYTKCRYCSEVIGDEVYITKYGEVYHSSENCSRIKRNITEVDADETSLPPCSKCGH